MNSNHEGSKAKTGRKNRLALAVLGALCVVGSLSAQPASAASGPCSTDTTVSTKVVVTSGGYLPHASSGIRW